MSGKPEKIESLLKRLNEGDKEAESELIPLVFDELKTLASRQLRRESPSQPLSTTALVHEAYLKLSGERDIEWRNRAQFLGVAARLMRRILVDHARARLSQKRSAGLVSLPLDEALVFTPERSSDLLALDDALGQLKLKDERTSRVVELRFFGGLTVRETAAAVGVAERTVRSDWNFGRAWLRAELGQAESAPLAKVAGDRPTDRVKRVTERVSDAAIRRSQIKELFEAALGVEAADRQAYLDRACGTDSELRNDVEQLLLADEHSGGLLDVEVAVEPAELEAGYLVADRFRIRRKIGTGGMGEVYEAEDIELGVLVALKMMRAEFSADPVVMQRLEREYRLTSGISHPNVCRVFDVGQFRTGGRDRVFLTMQFLKGQTLAERIHSEGKLHPEEALNIGRQMAAGLDAIHESGMVHRDLKPSNVILVPEESGELRAVISDFGSPQMAVHEGGFAGTVMRTGTYTAPEQLTGERISPATDVYAFGSVLLEMLTGRPPDSVGWAVDSLDKNQVDTPRSPRYYGDDVDERWGAAIDRCLERDPSKRFRHAGDVMRAIIGSSSAIRSGEGRFMTSVPASSTWPSIGGFFSFLGMFPDETSPKKWFSSFLDAIRTAGRRITGGAQESVPSPSQVDPREASFEDPPSEIVMRRYLLGELSDQERDRLDECYFSDDEQYELLSVLEDELIHDYVSGALSDEESKRFEAHNLRSPRIVRKAQLAEALIRATSKQK